MINSSKIPNVNKKPALSLLEIEHAAFCKSEDNLAARPLAEEFGVKVDWQKLPNEYVHLNAEELDVRIHQAKEVLGQRVLILGHHYQREEVIKYVDLQGDSFLLSQQAAARSESDFIIFCGVHFMAETARVLCSAQQRVILPNMAAGCSMADMAPTDDVLDAWDDLQKLLGSDSSVIPVTYMNSTAEIKALCGRNGGIVCTSSNAAAVMQWAFERGRRVLFLPDQHLGRNTALNMGIDASEMVVWNPFKAFGGCDVNSLRSAKVILWQGHCAVHTRFSVKQIRSARERVSDVKVIVHPECTMETVRSADMVGSTEMIRKTINESPPGSSWAVGTEISLVNRLAKQNPDKIVFCLDPIVCPCSTMYRIHPAYLCWTLERLLENEVVNEIVVDDDIAKDAYIALLRMLQVT
ncbi:quinolinate synthase NadA [SAR202 cluster bacterium AD-804-J14_MRT_500m]|nr:quinolinate synthase NadA [SAR202 cluster bacterium AD-804-J14_MRT_500m]